MDKATQTTGNDLGTLAEDARALMHLFLRTPPTRLQACPLDCLFLIFISI